MPYKDPARQRQAQADWYQARKRELTIKTQRERQTRYAVVNKLKLARGCDRCGHNRCVRALEFHHVGEKNFEISVGIRSCKNIDAILTECNLCELLCANCHRELHTD